MVKPIEVMSLILVGLVANRVYYTNHVTPHVTHVGYCNSYFFLFFFSLKSFKKKQV
jgi:hypothetical protein